MHSLFPSLTRLDMNLVCIPPPYPTSTKPNPPPHPTNASYAVSDPCAQAFSLSKERQKGTGEKC